jgi:hypothetical protein
MVSIPAKSQTSSHEPAFTPGPWEWSQSYDTIRLTSPAGEWVLSCYGGGIKNAADRAIIGASPEIYAALDNATGLLAHILGFYHFQGFPNTERACIETLSRARAALAKARGEDGHA